MFYTVLALATKADLCRFSTLKMQKFEKINDTE